MSQSGKENSSRRARLKHLLLWPATDLLGWLVIGIVVAAVPFPGVVFIGPVAMLFVLFVLMAVYWPRRRSG